jgi:hypothetical protein
MRRPGREQDDIAILTVPARPDVSAARVHVDPLDYEALVHAAEPSGPIGATERDSVFEVERGGLSVHLENVVAGVIADPDFTLVPGRTDVQSGGLPIHVKHIVAGVIADPDFTLVPGRADVQSGGLPVDSEDVVTGAIAETNVSVTHPSTQADPFLAGSVSELE